MITVSRVIKVLIEGDREEIEEFKKLPVIPLAPPIVDYSDVHDSILMAYFDEKDADAIYAFWAARHERPR